ncbi:MAG: pirin family protein [Candidatus Marinimicrobia bacterium]|nr:pirin family protein [Candidatus Neomarinimicrobiota bacterium]
MINLIKNETMGKADDGWLKTHYHFSFANYYNPDNMNFGVLRVLNDDTILPENGFDTHPHKNMEIITYVVEGELTHKDSHGNYGKIGRGGMQYMSAGSGIFHSEHNLGERPLRLLQLWILPEVDGLKPNYGELSLPWENRLNRWLKVVASVRDHEAPIQIYQDAVIFVAFLEKGKRLHFALSENRQAYLVQIEGNSRVNGKECRQRDALEVIGENIDAAANTDSHYLLIEMKKNGDEK